jgi:hypothetical protein
MANMSYCRFENTYRDLNDCVNALGEALDDGLTFKEFLDTLSETEQYYFKRMLTRAQDLMDNTDELRMVESKQLEDC